MRLNKTLHILSVTLFLLLTPPAFAQNNEVQIQSLLERTGFTRLLAHVPDFAQGVLKQSAGALDPEVNSALSAAFSQSFSTKNIRRKVLQTIQSHFDQEKAIEYLTLLDSPLAKEMAELERTPNQAEHKETFQKFILGQQSNPAVPERIELIKRLDDANNTTNFSVNMQTAFFKAVFSAVDPIMDTDMRLAKGELDKMVAEVRESLFQDIQKRTQLSYLYAFHTVDIKKLEEYIQLNESDNHRWAIQLLGNAMLSSLNQAAEHSAILMAQAAE